MSIEDFDTKVKKISRMTVSLKMSVARREPLEMLFSEALDSHRVKQKAIQKGNKVTLEYIMELPREEEVNTASL